MDLIKINVLKSFQKDQVVYIGNLTKRQAAELTFSDSYPPNLEKLGYQRPPNQKRAKTFARYIEVDNSGFITPIVLNAREKISFITDNDTDFGYILVPNHNCLAIVDGQHRALGIIDYFQEEISIPFMLFDNLPTDLERDLFITINREQKKVSMSHVHFVGKDKDPLSEMVIKLESDPESPWFESIKLVDTRGAKRPVSLQSLRSSLEALFQPGQIKIMSYDQKYELAVQYWKVVSEVWPEAWHAPKKSLLKKSMATLALSKLGGYLLLHCFDEESGEVDFNKVHFYLSRASSVDWMSEGNFKGFGGKKAAELIKSELDSIIFVTA